MSSKHFAGVIGEFDVVVVATTFEKAVQSALRFAEIVPAVAGVQADQVLVVRCDRAAARLLKSAARSRGFAALSDVRSAELRCDLELSVCPDCGKLHALPRALVSELVH